MKLVEFLDKEQDDKMPYDIVDDVHFHMLNDDAFYRKYYMPCMDKIRNKKNQAALQGYLNPMIDKCMNHYVNKYDIPKSPKELLKPEDRSKLCGRIMDYENTPDKDLLDASKTII
tara:strand:- start:2489 stop:2833 length:345 start_codon:yes stop_codon:yes gene_type:complete